MIVAGDDSDAFADDEAPSSDGMEERDDISLVSTVSSVGEDFLLVLKIETTKFAKFYK